MNMTTLIIVIIFLLFMFAFYRHDWVLKERIKMIEKDMSKYNTLHSYDYMFFRFWIWDIEKFVK